MPVSSFNIDSASSLDAACTQLLAQRSGEWMIVVHPEIQRCWYDVIRPGAEPLIVLGSQVGVDASVAPGDARIVEVADREPQR